MTVVEMKAVFDRAHQAGQSAAASVVPAPLIVHDVLSGYAYPPVMDGVCGFAWITIRPGNCALANFAKKYWKARKAYGGGVSIWVSEFGQSLARKDAYARAFAGVLREATGANVSAGSRMD